MTTPPAPKRTTGQLVEKGRHTRSLAAAGGNGDGLHAPPTHAYLHRGKYSRWPAPAPHPTCAPLACGGPGGAPPWTRPQAVIDPRRVQAYCAGATMSSQPTGVNVH